jgi:hypothetical protein
MRCGPACPSTSRCAGTASPREFGRAAAFLLSPPRPASRPRWSQSTAALSARSKRALESLAACARRSRLARRRPDHPLPGLLRIGTAGSRHVRYIVCSGGTGPVTWPAAASRRGRECLTSRSAALNRFAARAVVIGVDRERDPLGFAIPAGAVRPDPAHAWLVAAPPERGGSPGHAAVHRLRHLGPRPPPGKDADDARHPAERE